MIAAPVIRMKTKDHVTVEYDLEGTNETDDDVLRVDHPERHRTMYPAYRCRYFLSIVVNVNCYGLRQEPGVIPHTYQPSSNIIVQS